jgi:hypothetical protein
MSIARGVGLVMFGVFTLGVLAAGPACGDEPRPAEAPANALTTAEKKAGWKLLFDGKTTKGWRGYQKTGVPAAWSVVDGVLALAAKTEGLEAGDLVTVDQFESFELSLEWRVAPGGNGGVIYRVQETKTGRGRPAPRCSCSTTANTPTAKAR